MAEKPNRATGYSRDQRDHVQAACLYVATKLGDLLDETVIVGGLVPSLLIDQGKFESIEERHVGTMDLDLGLALALFNEQRYQALTERLREAGFSPDVNENGQPTRQRWKIQGTARVTVDFLIAPSDQEKPGRIKNIEQDFAAIIVPGLHLAFHDREQVQLRGRTIRDEHESRNVWVAGPGAFVILKALAFNNRGVNKDAYDLFYLLKYVDGGARTIAQRLEQHREDPSVRMAFDHLARHFADVDSIGPTRVAEFLLGRRDDDLQADARGLVLDLCDLCRQKS